MKNGRQNLEDREQNLSLREVPHERWYQRSCGVTKQSQSSEIASASVRTALRNDGFFSRSSVLRTLFSVISTEQAPHESEAT